MDPTKIKKSDALIAFGANQGDSINAWEQTIDLFRGDSRTLQLIHSDPVETAAVTGSKEGQSKYLNGILRILTTMTPIELHQYMIGIEQQLGRERVQRWGPRTIDLDLLLVGDQQISGDSLIVPHPRMSFRRFVLEPALQVAADMVHPESGKTLQLLVKHLDESENKILVATDSNQQAAELLSAIQSSQIDDNETAISVVETAQQFMQQVTGTRLAVSFFSDLNEEASDNSESLRRFAGNFAGPMLKLSVESGIEAAKIEILAAIEAMRP